jgi:hypothetical protein
MLHQIDHLLYGSNSLADGIRYICELTGVQPVMGGSHPGLGTHNALIGLDNNIYLEIIAPDPEQSVERVWMDLDQLEHPRLFRWAATAKNVEKVRQAGLAAGFDIGEVKAGSRYKPDGSLLEWTLSDPNVDLANGLIPFFIDWGVSGNPSPDLPQGCTLTGFKAFHPEPVEVMEKLSALHLDLQVKQGTVVQLKAEIDTPNGMITLT